MLIVSVLNRRLCKSHRDVKMRLWKWLQLVAGSEYSTGKKVLSRPLSPASEITHLLPLECLEMLRTVVAVFLGICFEVLFTGFFFKSRHYFL